MREARKLPELLGLHLKVPSILTLSATLLVLPANAQAQGPPGQGDCKDCAIGTYCHWEGEIWHCYEFATFCALGTLEGWEECDDNPPYGSCTVEDVCLSEIALTFVPEGVVGALPEMFFASALPCPPVRNEGAAGRAVWINSRKAAFLDSRDFLLAWLISS